MKRFYYGIVCEFVYFSESVLTDSPSASTMVDEDFDNEYSDIF